MLQAGRSCLFCRLLCLPGTGRQLPRQRLAPVAGHRHRLALCGLGAAHARGSRGRPAGQSAVGAAGDAEAGDSPPRPAPCPAVSLQLSRKSLGRLRAAGYCCCCTASQTQLQHKRTPQPAVQGMHRLSSPSSHLGPGCSRGVGWQGLGGHVAEPKGGQRRQRAKLLGVHRAPLAGGAGRVWQAVAGPAADAL